MTKNKKSEKENKDLVPKKHLSSSSILKNKYSLRRNYGRIRFNRYWYSEDY